MLNLSPEKVLQTRRRMALLLAAALVLLAAGLFMLREPLREHSEASKAASALSSMTKAMDERGVFPPAFTDPRPDLSNRADYVDVCGVGRVQVQSDGRPDPKDLVDRTNTQRLLDAAAASLAANGKDLDRAVGLLVTSVHAARIEPKDGTRMTDESRQQLARLAVASRDPAAYALAFYACGLAARVAGTTGACTQISAAHWALLDPDNAVPWLYEADAAQRRNDPKGVDDALLRASQAKTLRPYIETPLRLIDAPAMRSAPPLSVGAVSMSLLGISSALPRPNLQLVSQYCARTAKGAAERNQVCGGLAEALGERSTVLISMRLGAVIGERAGWPAERVAAIRTRRAALQQAQTEAIDRKDPYSCAAIERNRHYLTAYARYGEVGAVERAGAASQRGQK